MRLWSASYWFKFLRDKQYERIGGLTHGHKNGCTKKCTYFKVLFVLYVGRFTKS